MKYLVSSILRFLHTIYYLLHTTSQRGFAPLALIIFLLFGIAAGTLLVQNGARFLPHAQGDCPEGYTSSGQEGSDGLTACIQEGNSGSPSESKSKDKPDSEAIIGSGNNQSPSNQEALNPVTKENIDACDKKETEEAKKDCKNKICAADTVTYCDNRDGRLKAIRKTGGYYDDKNPDRDKSNNCVFAFVEVPEKNPECQKDNSKSGDVVYTTKNEATVIDKSIKDTEALREKATKCISEIVCTGDKKAERRVSTYDEERDTCKKDTIEVTGVEGCDGKNNGKVIERSDPGTFKPYSSVIERTALKVRTEQQNKDLSDSIAAAKSKTTNTAILEELNKAQANLDGAKALLDQCFKTGAESDCASAYSSQINAVVNSRTALANAIASGATGVKVKTAIVSPTQVGVVAVLATDGRTNEQKPVFAQYNATTQKVELVVRCDSGFCPAVNPTGGLSPTMTKEDYQKWLTNRFAAINPPSTASRTPASNTDEWKRVDNNLCKTNCASYPSDSSAQCYFNQTRNLYNCSRDIGAYCENDNWCNSGYCDLSKKTCQIRTAAATPAPTANQGSINLSNLLKEEASDLVCSKEGVTCKFFTNSQKNDGVILYTGKSNITISLLAPNGQIEFKLDEIATNKSIKTAQELNDYFGEIMRKDAVFTLVKDNWDKYLKNGGKVLLPKVAFLRP